MREFSGLKLERDWITRCTGLYLAVQNCSYVEGPIQIEHFRILLQIELLSELAISCGGHVLFFHDSNSFSNSHAKVVVDCSLYEIKRRKATICTLRYCILAGYRTLLKCHIAAFSAHIQLLHIWICSLMFRWPQSFVRSLFVFSSVALACKMLDRFGKEDWPLWKTHFLFLIFVVPSIMLYSSEISPTRCNNCVFILRTGFTLHVSGDNLTHSCTGKPVSPVGRRWI